MYLSVIILVTCWKLYGIHTFILNFKNSVTSFWEKKIYFHKIYLQKNHTHNSKHTINKRQEIKKEEKEMGVTMMSFNQSRDIIRSRCSAYILFMQSTRWITYNQNFSMITNNIIYNIVCLYSYNYIHTII